MLVLNFPWRNRSSSQGEKEDCTPLVRIRFGFIGESSFVRDRQVLNCSAEDKSVFVQLEIVLSEVGIVSVLLRNSGQVRTSAGRLEYME